MKNNGTLSRPAPADTSRQSFHDEIAKRARRLWEEYGKPAGRDEMIWLEAERELLGMGLKARPAGRDKEPC